jgi:hypothetical protein
VDTLWNTSVSNFHKEWEHANLAWLHPENEGPLQKKFSQDTDERHLEELNATKWDQQTVRFKKINFMN